MTRFAVNCPSLPQAGPYSHSIVANGQVFVSGQLPISPDTAKFVQGGPAEQAKQSLANIALILAEQGMSLADVAKCTIFLTDIEDFADVNAVYAEHFSEPMPARSAFAVAALPGGAKVEIEAIAVIGRKDVP